MEFKLILTSENVLHAISLMASLGKGEPMDILKEIICKHSGDTAWSKARLTARNSVMHSLIEAGIISVRYKGEDTDKPITCITYTDNSQTFESVDGEAPIFTKDVYGKLSIDDAFVLVADKVVPANDWVVHTVRAYFDTVGEGADKHIETDDILITESPLIP